MTKQQDDNVVGLGGDMSVYTVNEIDFNQLIEDAVRSANVRLRPDAVNKPAQPGEWGTLETPAILFGSGDVKISGGGAGSGILVVDGNLTISGSFEWRGLVIARGQISFAGGGGTKRVTGGVVVERDVLSGTTEPSRSSISSIDFSVNGTVDILFSKATLANSSRATR